MWLTMSSSLNSSPSSLCAPAQLGEQVVAAVAALGRQVRAEELLEERAGLQALGPRRARDRLADDRGAGAHGGDERLVDLVLLRGAQVDADEGLQGQVEGERLEQVVQPRVLHSPHAARPRRMCGTITAW